MTLVTPPVAKKVPLTFELHGDKRTDDYYWMNEKTNPEVIAHLEAENTYYKEFLKPLEPQINEIYEEMIARIPLEETNAPVQNGSYFYYIRQEKELQYPIHARKKALSRVELANAVEEIVLDENEAAKNAEYYTVTLIKTSPDEQHIAYLENRDGSDNYTLYIKNLQTGELLSDSIPGVYIYESLEWSACGKYLFYIKTNEQQRPFQLWRHEVGASVDQDALLFEEKDVTFNLYVWKSSDGQYIFVTSHSTTTTENQFIHANNPLNAPQIIIPRLKNIDYGVEHYNGQFLILTNEDALNFKLDICAVEDTANRKAFVPYDEANYIQGIFPHKTGLFITGRANGLDQVWRYENNKLVQLQWDEDIYAVNLTRGQNYHSDEVLIDYVSFITPKTIYSIDQEGNKIVVQQKEVAGTYDASLYTQKQVWATAPDGVKVPVLLQYKKDALEEGTAPLILEAYGSYGYSSDPFFSEYRLPILDRGVVFATAQVRGGSELGRTWYYDGKLKKKMNTFTDFIAAADYLVQEGYTTNEQLIGCGGSAGGLLIGAVSNLAGTKFKVLVPEVPFVDVLTTMLDETIPLTTAEWDEWGNPKIEADYYYMRMYSPYDNVEEKEYPHLFVTAGLNDPRVGYFEPAKWVARLREMKTDNNTLLFKINMDGGHYGASGRKNQLREAAEYYAFVLSKVGLF